MIFTACPAGHIIAAGNIIRQSLHHLPRRTHHCRRQHHSDIITSLAREGKHHFHRDYFTLTFRFSFAVLQE
jgi:hypothetical protein